MDQLRLVGVHDDGEHLIVETADSTRFVLRIDQQLRQAVQHARRKPAGRGRAAGQFGPRDIQARFRAGATVEQIAAESGWEPERVRRYEWPILTERAHRVREACKVKVTGTSPTSDGYRSVFEGEPRSLEETVRHRAEATGVAADSFDWDAWQREDQLWTVQLRFTVSDPGAAPLGCAGPAEWTYNPANGTVRPGNEWAEVLGQEPVETGPLGTTAPASLHGPAPDPHLEQLQREAARTHELLDVLQARRGRRLGSDIAEDDRLAEILGRGMGHLESRPRPIDAPADSEVFTQPIQPAAVRVAEERALAEDDGIEIVDDSPQVPEPHELPDAPASPQLPSPAPDAEQGPRTGQPVASGDRDREDSPGPADRETREAPEHDEVLAEAASSDVSEQKAGEQEAQESAGDEAGAPQEAGAAQPAGEDTEQEPAKAPGPRARTPKARRSSVPSWDDIVFGSNRS